MFPGPDDPTVVRAFSVCHAPQPPGAEDRQMGLRIALVSREFPPDSGGGIGSYAARIAPALANAGARVHVITRRLASDEPEIDTTPGVTVHRIEMGDRSGESCLRASIVAAQKLLDIAYADGLDAIEFAE